MFKNYLKIAWRNMMKNKGFSFINVFGLSVGLTCCMLIGLYLHHEFSYDDYHKNSKQLYQLGTIFVKEGKEERTPNTPALMAKAMQMEFPEIRKATRLLRAFSDDKTLLQYGPPNKDKESFYESKAFLADSNFFQVLTYHFKEGNPATALTNPNSLVISDEIAKKIFGDEPAINKIVHISSGTNGDFDFKVTGVFVPSKSPTHIDARLFMSMNGGQVQGYFQFWNDLATNNMFHTYFELQSGSDPKKLEAKFPAFVDKYAGKDLKAMGFYKKQFLTRVKDIHLYSNMPNNVTPSGSLTYLYILGSIAVFTLLIACINFMNLSTARSSKRSAEVGVRKVLGAEKGSLIRQFLGESVLMSIFAFVIAFCLMLGLLPLFSRLSGKDLSFSFQNHWMLLIAFFLLAIVTGLLAGSYPAFYLSSFRPVKVLKGKISNTLAAVSLRKALVIFQFIISVVLIISSVIIYNQMRYMRNKDLGFIKDQQIVIPMRSNTAKGIYGSLKNELGRNPQVQSIGATIFYPGIPNYSDMPLYKEGNSMNDSKRVYMNAVDDNYLQTLGIKPVAGRLFSKDFPGDTNFQVILNETAVKALGFSDTKSVEGKNAKFDWQGQTYTLPVIGIVKDFHFQGFQNAIEPYGFQLNRVPQFNYMIARVSPKNISGTLKSMESTWNRLNPNEPFEYSFLDADFQKTFEAENKLLSIVGCFTVMAILISCLGLFGLATFSAEQRIKEIGVRKVLGASVPSIVGLLSKDFLKLVAIAIVIASPVAWWAMNKWLEDFAYKTNISWTVFVVTTLAAMCIALITISFQAIKAAIANPVRSLRTE